MKTSTLQAAIATNASVINLYQSVITSFLDSAKQLVAAGEKSLANEDYKHVRKNRVALAKLVKNQKELLTELRANHQRARIEAKVIRAFGKTVLDEVNPTPLHTAAEIEAALDEVISIKFPAKQDTRPADHPSFKKAA